MESVAKNSEPSSPGEGKQSQKSRARKGKGAGGRSRFQLFDPALKADLGKLCGDGFVRVVLENEVVQDKEDATVSLEFDESDDDEVVEAVPEVKQSPPEDGCKKGGRRKVVKPSLGQQVFCGSCNVGFTDVADQRLHYTLDWHRYNVKRKLKGQDCVSEAKFSEMMDDLSSIDGSEDEDEDVPGPGAQIERLLEKLDVGSCPSQKTEVVKLSSSQKMEKSPKIFFRNSQGQVITCYKCIFPSASKIKQGDGSEPDLVSSFKNCLDKPIKFTIIMSSGGHFAAAVFEGNSCINHKTFHSYTVRAKQGGSQGSRDAKSGTSNPKSAGASLRRYNEQSHTQHVQDLLASWRAGLAESQLIFFRANSFNANILFGGKNPPFNKDSIKLRTIPFPTKRPTFNEVQRVHSLLTTVHVYESMESFLGVHTYFIKNTNSNKVPGGSPKNKKTYDRAKSRSPKRKDDLDFENILNNKSDSDDNYSDNFDEVEHTVDLTELKEYDDSLTSEQRNQARHKVRKPKVKKFKLEGPLGDMADLLRNGDVDTFTTLLKQEHSTLALSQPVDDQSSTLLHLASKSNLQDIIWMLLETGCDPSLKDKCGKYPYNYCETREARDTFRRFMGQFPEKYDYAKAQVPPPLSEEMEKERAEKKKLLNKLKREKEKQKKMERKEKEKETEEERRFLSLSDREKRALAAEQRILAQCKRNAEKAPVLVRCFECAADITGKVPFEYNQNLFCTSKCLVAHRKKHPSPLSV